MNRPQNGDELPLSEMLAAMRRIGVPSEPFIVGYEDGYLDGMPPVVTSWSAGGWIAYQRGHKAGRDANARGAHKENA